MSIWPSLRVDDWTETREALHLWSQVIGKIKLAHAPLINHWWNVTFYVTPRGLTTATVPAGAGLFQIDFDFVDSRLRIEALGAEQSEVVLRSMSVADFYAESMAALRQLGIEVSIYPVPVEREEAVPFDADTRVRAYDPDHARTFWYQLVSAHRVMSNFRTRFVGKVSPVHFFWGSFDLAVTRFSGRTAPRHQGGIPNTPDRVMVEGYSHELSSCGFWPGGGAEGAFYAYAYPEPPGFSDASIRPNQAAYNGQLGQFLLPYEAVRTSGDPDATAIAFFEDTYAATAELAGWDPSLAAGPKILHSA